MAYPKPSLTVDLIIINQNREILLIKRGKDPFKDKWAFPGGFVNENEPLEVAARRELAEETTIAEIGELHQFKTFGDPGRDPRGWVVTVAFAARVEQKLNAVGSDDAAEAQWFKLDELPELAFDHAQILEEYLLWDLAV